MLANYKVPLRIISGFGAHTIGGVGTPYWLKRYNQPIEVACFTHGCNLRCSQCQNYTSDVQVCILDYRPEFRRKNLTRPLPSEMLELKMSLNDVGLKTVIVQTSKGHSWP